MFIFYVCERFAYTHTCMHATHICTPCVPGAHTGQKRCGCWGLNPCPLEEQVLFPAEPWLQALGAVCVEKMRMFLEVEWWQWLQNSVNALDAIELNPAGQSG